MEYMEGPAAIIGRLGPFISLAQNVATHGNPQGPRVREVALSLRSNAEK